MSLIKSSPLPSPRVMSTTTTSGLSLRIIGIVSAVDSAPPQTIRSGSSSMSMLKPWRTTGWSSTSRTRAFLPVNFASEVSIAGLCCAANVVAGDHGATSCAISHVNRRPDHSGAVAHNPQSHAVGRRLGAVHSLTVVDYLKVERIAGGLQEDLD